MCQFLREGPPGGSLFACGLARAFIICFPQALIMPLEEQEKGQKGVYKKNERSPTLWSPGHGSILQTRPQPAQRSGGSSPNPPGPKVSPIFDVSTLP